MNRSFVSLIIIILYFISNFFSGLGIAFVEYYDVSNVIFENETFVYDGEEHFISIQGDLPEELDVKYENNNHVKAGTYKVKAKLITKNLRKTYKKMTAMMEIVKNGQYHDVTFIYEDGTQVNKVVQHGAYIKDYPLPNKKIGYTGVWQYDFSKPIIDDTIINMEYVPNSYKITLDCKAYIKTIDVLYNEKIDFPDINIYGYNFNGWKYQNFPFKDEYYTFTHDIKLEADLKFNNAIQGFNYLYSGGNIDYNQYNKDGEIYLEDKTFVPFGDVYDKKWYVEFEVKYIDTIANNPSPKIGIMYGDNVGGFDDKVSTSSYFYLDYTDYGVRGEWKRLGFAKNKYKSIDWANSTTYITDYFYINQYYKIGMLRKDDIYYLYFGKGDNYKCIDIITDTTFNDKPCLVWVEGFSCKYAIKNGLLLTGNKVDEKIKTSE